MECDPRECLDAFNPFFDLGLQPGLLRGLLCSDEASDISCAFLISEVEAVVAAMSAGEHMIMLFGGSG